MVLKYFCKAITFVTKKKSSHSNVEMYEDSLIRSIDQLANFTQYHSDNSSKSKVPENIATLVMDGECGNNSILNEQIDSVKQYQLKENEKFDNSKTMLKETPNSV
ncbi:uncharacterized protein LOC126905667 [Daktulosphaira vitifoliae]|uniref:uncharacterized protein LOC126905667 n=1 Tax=Daktulosphaira vitifoliae TaxID=58002 RepID=UPI0021AA6A72|nr:uncharacterized protein LOC126905667 [Daktulosphaira vitifoliae]